MRVNGKRLFFRTEASAEKELARLKIKQRKEGQNALSVSDSLRIMALECAGELQQFGKTIRDATDLYLKYLREALRSVTIDSLIDYYLATQRKLKPQRFSRRKGSKSCSQKRRRIFSLVSQLARLRASELPNSCGSNGRTSIRSAVS